MENLLWVLGNTLDRTSLLLGAGLAAALALQAGCFNLGGEGQIYMAGLACAVFAKWGLAAGASAAMLVGLLCGGFCGLLKKTCRANELLSTFLLSSALLPVGDFLITGPLRDKSGSLIATAPLPSVLPRVLPPSSLSLSFFFAVLLVLAWQVFAKRTRIGYIFKLTGSATDFARYVGIEPERLWTPTLALSGALFGLTGFFKVAGTEGRCYAGFSGGLGWAGLAVALIARKSPLFLFPAALVYALIEQGLQAANLALGLGLETTGLFQGILLLLLSNSKKNS